MGEPQDTSREFLAAMATALSRYGQTADVIEDGLYTCAATLGVEFAMFSVPTAVFVSYGHGGDMHTRMLHTRAADIDLQALDELNVTLRAVSEGRISAAQGLAEVRLITVSPLRFPWYMRVLAAGLAAAAISVLLGGGVREVVASVPVGLAVGVTVVAARRMRRLTSLLELLAGFLAAVLTLALGHVLPHFHLATVVLAGIILLLPGLSITLAVSELGTATAPLYLSHAAGVPFKVYADETRPLLQGARLTAWELAEAGIDVTVLCDNAAASLMAAGKIDLVLVGTDRVTANGDVVNKIGTLNLAVLCRYFEIPFYVACPSSTFDPDTATGAEVIIEQRAAAEVIGAHTADVAVYNPAFDVTPVALVTGLITDRGLLLQPAERALLNDFQALTGPSA